MYPSKISESIKITKPTDAIITLKEDNYEDVFHQIMFEYITNHFTATEMRDSKHRVIYKITDDDVYEMLDYIYSTANKVFKYDHYPNTDYFNFKLTIEYLKKGRSILEREFNYDSNGNSRFSTKYTFDYKSALTGPDNNE